MIRKVQDHQAKIGNKRREDRHGLILLLCLLVSPSASADTVNVAVAANFVPTMRLIEAEFEAISVHRINLISGSSGKHFAQILNGAPYHLLLSADQERVELLKLQSPESVISSKTYAIGRLALWSRQSEISLGPDHLQRADNYNRLAIANPNLAPYGRAAMEALGSMGLSRQALSEKLVFGENVGQAFQYAYSGNADLGLVAHSQLISSNVSGSYWILPESLHSPIQQDVALLDSSEASRSLYQYLSSETAIQIILQNGYELAEPGGR